MDLGNKTLNGILEAIAAENDLVGYNTYRNRKGRIIVKISYEEPSESDQIEDSNSEFDSQRISFRKLSKTQSKRNFHRAKKFRDQNSTVPNIENSIEIPRNADSSTSTPNVLEVSQCANDPCLPESQATHVISDHDHSCEAEQFHDVPDSISSVTPDVQYPSESDGSNSSGQKADIWKPPPYTPFKSKVYDSDKFKTPWDAAKEPCDSKNCSFGPTPDKIDQSVVDAPDNIIRKCPHCELIVCQLCRKYRGRHRKFFITPPPWDD